MDSPMKMPSVEHPVRLVRGRDEGWHGAIVHQCPSLREGFVPRWWARSAHVQTLMFAGYEAAIRMWHWDLDSRLELPDGGTVSVQWAGLDAPRGTPVIVLLPTITGSGDDLRRVVAALRRATSGWVVAVCNRRGHGGLPLTAPQSNTMGSTADLRRQIEAIEQQRPGAALYGLGLSAGSGLLVRYLGEAGPASKLRAGVAHCPGYDIRTAFDRVHPFYDRVMTRRLVEFFIRTHAESWRGVAGIEASAQSKNLTEFHDRQFALSGHRDRDDYYAHSNPMVVADDIETPVLVINAIDDPVCSIANVTEQVERLQQRPRLTLAVTRFGGHCGFFGRVRTRASWAEQVFAEYLLAAHRTLGDESGRAGTTEPSIG